MNLHTSDIEYFVKDGAFVAHRYITSDTWFDRDYPNAREVSYAEVQTPGDIPEDFKARAMEKIDAAVEVCCARERAKENTIYRTLIEKRTC